MSLLTFPEDGARPPVGEDLQGVTLDGRYRIDSKLDAIASRTLWQATDLQKERPVTLQVFSRDNAPAERLLTAALLRQPEGVHPAFIASEACGRTPDGATYSVHARLEGLYFDSWIATHSLPAHDMAEVAIDLVAALAALHRSGQIHGRLGLQMIFLEAGRSGSTLRLFDAGIEAIPAVPRGSAIRGEMVHVGALLERLSAATDTFDPAPHTAEILAGMNALVERTREIAVEPLPDLDTLATRLRALPELSTRERDRGTLHQIPWQHSGAPTPAETAAPAPLPETDEVIEAAPVAAIEAPATDFSGLIALPGPKPARPVEPDALLPELAFPLPPPAPRPESDAPPMPTRHVKVKVKRATPIAPFIVVGLLVAAIVSFALILTSEPQPSTPIDVIMPTGSLDSPMREASQADVTVATDAEAGLDASPADTAQDILDTTADTAQDILDTTADTAQDILDTTADTAQDILDTTADTAQDILDTTADTVIADTSAAAPGDVSVSPADSSQGGGTSNATEIPDPALPFEQLPSTRVEIGKVLDEIERVVIAARPDKKGAGVLRPLREKLVASHTEGKPHKLEPQVIYFFVMKQLNRGLSVSETADMVLSAHMKGKL
jgi:hypothetical protein